MRGLEPDIQRLVAKQRMQKLKLAGEINLEDSGAATARAAQDQVERLAALEQLFSETSATDDPTERSAPLVAKKQADQWLTGRGGKGAGEDGGAGDRRPSHINWSEAKRRADAKQSEAKDVSGRSKMAAALWDESASDASASESGSSVAGRGEKKSSSGRPPKGTRKGGSPKRPAGGKPTKRRKPTPPRRMQSA